MISIVVNLSSLWICRKNYCTAAVATAVTVMVVLDFGFWILDFEPSRHNKYRTHRSIGPTLDGQAIRKRFVWQSSLGGQTDK
jgi:hypothetical protein